MSSTPPKDTAPAARASRIFVLLHLACCGAPLLIALGALGGFGMIDALLADPLAAAGAVALAVLAGVFVVAQVVRRRRAAAGAECDCSVPARRTGQSPFMENPAHFRTRTAGSATARNNDDGTRPMSGVRF